MSLKAELEVWASALAAYDAERFDESLELFSVSGPPLLPLARVFRHGTHPFPLGYVED